jgi:hypothetical protein
VRRKAGPTLGAMAPKEHYMPLSGGDRKALTKELSKSRAMTRHFRRAVGGKETPGRGTLIREADNLSCQSWNEKMWSDGRANALHKRTTET